MTTRRDKNTTQLLTKSLIKGGTLSAQHVSRRITTSILYRLQTAQIDVDTLMLRLHTIVNIYNYDHNASPNNYLDIDDIEKILISQKFV